MTTHSGKLARVSLSLSFLAAMFLIGGRKASAAEASGWQAKGMVKGMWVDERPVPHSGFNEVRVSALRSESAQQICDAITRENSKRDEHLRVHEVLHETPTERWTYERVKLPSVADRDYVVHMKVDRSGGHGACEVSFQNEDDPKRPPVDGAVRLKAMHGQWNVSPTPDGKVSVTYQLFTDPGGNIPAFFAHGPMRDATVDFFKGVMARAQLMEASR